MPLTDMRSLFEVVLSTIGPDSLPQESLERLSLMFSEFVLVAALDYIDRDRVIRIVMPWGKSHYEVLGEHYSRTVSTNLPAPAVSVFCSCPTYADAVLLSGSHIMCKHALAVCIAQRMERCVERVATAEDALAFFSRHHLGPRSDFTT
ncbi:unnamed protein product [Peniophora sp. CBMAI 1063]|nr:unnamed protein product [Peniophora sp. CBMAI 1063]